MVRRRCWCEAKASTPTWCGERWRGWRNRRPSALAARGYRARIGLKISASRAPHDFTPTVARAHEGEFARRAPERGKPRYFGLLRLDFAPARRYIPPTFRQAVSFACSERRAPRPAKPLRSLSLFWLRMGASPASRNEAQTLPLTTVR